MKKVGALILAAMLLLLCGCGRETYTFTVLRGNDAETVSVRSGEILEGTNLIYTADGDVFYGEDYCVKTELAGVIAEPPDTRVTDAYYAAAEAIEKGERVLLIYIDGLGYSAYTDALSDGDIPNLEKLNCKKAASVFPTITPVNYAAMVTGQPPKINGVTARGMHKLSCPTIFDFAAENGVSSYASEGDTQIIVLNNTYLELSPDMNGNGTGDDEIFEAAMNVVDDYGLLFVHFHSVDDASHAYSPTSQEARDALKTVDEWCGELMNVWDGTVIVTADHGQHVQDGTGDEAYSDKKGTHGDFASSDIFVPFMTNKEG